MLNGNIFTIPITPIPAVRQTQGQDWITKKSDSELRSKSAIQLKYRLLRYYKYKDAIKDYCKLHRFELPQMGFALYFFFPMAVHGKTRRAKGRELYHLTAHTKRPDIDNCIKPILDSLFRNDGHICNLTAGKYQVDADQGWIEIHTGLPVYDPRNRDYSGEAEYIKMEDVLPMTAKGIDETFERVISTFPLPTVMPEEKIFGTGVKREDDAEKWGHPFESEATESVVGGTKVPKPDNPFPKTDYTQEVRPAIIVDLRDKPFDVKRKEPDIVTPEQFRLLYSDRVKTSKPKR